MVWLAMHWLDYVTVTSWSCGREKLFTRMGSMSRKASKFYENTNKNHNVDTRMLQRGNVGKEQSICGQCVFFNNPTDEQSQAATGNPEAQAIRSWV